MTSVAYVFITGPFVYCRHSEALQLIRISFRSTLRYSVHHFYFTPFVLILQMINNKSDTKQGRNVFMNTCYSNKRKKNTENNQNHRMKGNFLFFLKKTVKCVPKSFVYLPSFLCL